MKGSFMFKDAIKLVHCLVGKTDHCPSGPEVRFIPQVEFDLWKYMVTRQYHFTVSDERIFMYIPRREYEAHEALYSRLPQIELNKITLYFFLKTDQLLVPVTRYFAKEQYPTIKLLFLSHFKAFEDRNHATKVLEEIIEEEGLGLRNL
jgi:hypothetical protein